MYTRQNTRNPPGRSYDGWLESDEPPPVQSEWTPTTAQQAECDKYVQMSNDAANEALRIRYATRGAPGPKHRLGTPRRAEPSCRPYSVAEFAAIVERANTTGAPPQAVGPQPPVEMYSGSHPRQFLHVRRSRPEPIPWGSAPPQAEEVCAYDRGPGRRPWPPIPPTSGPPRLVFPPQRLAREKPRPSVAPYLASIDTTLKELDAELTQTRLMTPYINRVTRILERLEQREARDTCPVPAARTPSPHAEYTTRPVAQYSAPAPPRGSSTPCTNISRDKAPTVPQPAR